MSGITVFPSIVSESPSASDVFNVVTGFGADPTGATDTTPSEQEAINKAAEVGGTVFYPTGTYKRTGAPPKIPVNLAKPIRIKGQGIDDVIFSLSEGVLRVFDFAASVAGNTLGNCEFSDFTVNGNNQVSANGDHVVIGTFANGVTRGNVNILNCWVRRIKTVNIPMNAAAAQGRRTVYLAVFHAENGMAKNEIFNCGVEDCQLEGGNYGVGIVGTAPSGQSANVFLDEIYIRKVRHICPVPTTSSFSASVQVGSVGWGRRVVVEDVYSKGAKDVGVEIDNMTAVTCNRCLVEEAWNEAYLMTNFICAGDSEPVMSTLAAEVVAGAGPVTVKLVDPVAVAEKLAVGDSFLFQDGTTTSEIVTVESIVNNKEITVSTVANNHAAAVKVQRVGNLSKQRFLLENCRARRTSAVQGQAYIVQNSNNVVPIGEVVLRDCTWYRRTADFGSESGEAFQCQCGITGLPKILRVSNFTGQAEKVAYVGAAVKIPSMFRVVGNSNTVETELDLADIDLSYEGKYVEGGGGLEAQMIVTVGIKAAINARNLKLQLNMSTSNKKLARLIYFQSTNVGALHGQVQGVTVRPSTNDEKIRALQVGSVAGFTERLLISGLDTRGLPAGSTDTSFGAESGQLVTILPGNAWRGAPKGEAFVLGASGEAKRLEKGFCGTISLVAGTVVTKIEVSNDGENYQAVLTQAGAALTGFSVPVMNGSYIKVTYTTVPTAIFMPLP